MTALEHVTLVSKNKLLLLLLPLLLSILSLELLSLPQADLYHLEQDLLHLLNLAQGLLHCVLLLKPPPQSSPGLHQVLELFFSSDNLSPLCCG